MAFSCANAHATMELIVRRTRGEFIIAASQRYANIPNSLVAETLLSRMWYVRPVKEEEWPDVTFQYDCQVLVEMWN